MAAYFAKPPMGSRLQRGDPLAKGLVAAWLFNEGSGGTAVDSVNGAGRYTGTLTNFAFTSSFGWTSGAYGRQLTCDGSNDYVSLPSARVPTSYPITIIALVSSTTLVGYQPIFSIGTADSSQILARLALRGDVVGDPVEVVSVQGSVGTAQTSTSFTTGAPLHCAAVLASGASRAVYLNGGGKGTDTTSLSPSPNVWNLAADPAGSAPLPGALIGAWYYNRALSDAEIVAHAADPFRMFRRRRVPVPVRPQGSVPNTATVFLLTA